MSFHRRIARRRLTVRARPKRLFKIVDKRSPTAPITTTFTWAGSLPKSINEAGGTATWSYNNDLIVTDETLAVGSYSSKSTFNYDADGLLICSSLGTCADGQAERLKIDRDAASGRVTAVTLGTSPKDSLFYNTYGELWYQDTPNLLRIEYEDQSASPAVLRDTRGRVQRKYDRMAGVAKTFNYTYDSQFRLWKVGGAVTSEYQYDNAGNRTYVSNSAGILGSQPGEIVYNAQDQLTTYGNATTGVTPFDYTPKGDIWHRYAPEGTYTYDYDALGALRFVRHADGRVITYAVDGLGRRISKSINGQVTKKWLYGAGIAPLAELDATGSVKMRFVYGSKSNVPELIKTYPDNKVYRLYSDQLGSPRVVWDVAATVGSTPFKTMEWDEFGIKLPDTNASFEIPFGFAGGLYDPDTKLTRFGARDYDPSIGRWVSKDPARFDGGQANLYVYAGNDPVNATDPSGQIPIISNLVCAYEIWKLGDAYDECHKELADKLSRSTCIEDDADALNGAGNFSDAEMQCVKQRDPGRWTSALSWCGDQANQSMGAAGGGILKLLRGG